MNWEALRSACLALPGALEDQPFGPDTLVFKVGDKMFAILNFAVPAEISLKCDPGRAEMLREQYAAVRPGYHLNKTHWNTVTSDGSLPVAELLDLLRHSYELVFARLPKAVRQSIL